MHRLMLLRHAATTLTDGRCMGQLDVPLSPSGRIQASRLTSLPLSRNTLILCSDLQRARQTAEPLLNKAGEVHIDPRLRELDMGDWEGLPWDDIHDRWPQALKAWGEDWIETSPPGGETARALYTRALQCLSEAPTDRPLLVISHAGPLRAIACHNEGQGPERLFDHNFLHAAPLSLV